MNNGMNTTTTEQKARMFDDLLSLQAARAQAQSDMARALHYLEEAQRQLALINDRETALLAKVHAL